MDCVRCQKGIPDEAVFCPWCGKRQPAFSPPPQRKERRRPKGSGSVRKLNDSHRAKPWMARTGKGELLGMCATSSEAVAALDAYNVKHSNVARMRYTFADVYEKWKAVHLRTLAKKGNTATSRRSRKPGRCKIVKCGS